MRFLVVQNANATLPTKYAALMRGFNDVGSDEFDDMVDEIVDEIEQEEIRLKKQEVMFKVIAEQDQAYYRTLIEKTDEQIAEAMKTITQLEGQLTHER